MKLTVTNEDGSTMEWFVHVYRERPEFNHNRATVCTVHEGPCNISEDQCLTPCLGGDAKCSPKDNFSRRIGRKIAFTRAIKQLPREQRQKLWIAYLAVVKVA